MTVLLFVATILTFLGIDYLVRRSRGESLAGAVQTQAQPELRVPEGIFFSKTHTWLNLFPSGKMQLGIDDFVKRMFAHPQITLLKAEGEMMKKGEAIISMREGANTFYVHAPIDGRVTQLNTRLAGTSAADHFVHGWAYAVEPKNGASELRNFLLGTETRQWMKNEFARLRDFMAATTASQNEYATVLLQDGGEPMPGVLSGMTPDQCSRFETEFLAND